MNRIMQYLPLTKARASYRILKKLDRNNVGTVLDLEDSAQDLFSVEKTAKLKEKARDGLRLISEKYDWDITSNIYVRVNPEGTPYYEDDLKLIEEVIKNKTPISGIVLPKTETYSQVESLSTRFDNAGLELEVIPLVETANGIKNLHLLLEQDVGNRIKRVAFGLFDFCLDSKIWPFPEPNQKEFWDVVAPMAKLLEKHGKTYFHTPFPHLYNENYFWQANNFLKNLEPNLTIWYCTLNTELSLSKEKDDLSELSLEKVETNKTAILNDAECIYNQFLESKTDRRSFGVSNSKFIPPHQFIGAQRYIENNKQLIN